MQGRFETFSRLFSVLFIIGICISWYMRSSLDDFMVRAFDTRAKNILTDMHSSQTQYHKKFKTYSADRKAIGYVEYADLARMFFEPKELPANMMTVLPQEHLPYVAQDSFKILLAIEHKSSGQLDFWTLSHDGSIEKLTEKITRQ